MRPRRHGFEVLIALSVMSSSCSHAGSFENLMDIGACDPDATEFTLEIDNPFFPLLPGQRTVLEGEAAGGTELVRITVLDEVESVAGVDTRVVEEHESLDGRVVEISRNYFAQTVGGTVCYLG
ncbi:MAG TPA: hypothetical protein VNC60_07020 [Actinomycetota bacterium]|nr:hypothetical protein [Actinomycetota bacterium]